MLKKITLALAIFSLFLGCKTKNRSLPEISQGSSGSQADANFANAINLDGAPSGYYSQSLLTINVVGEGLSQYRYRLNVDGVVGCDGESGYSQPLPIGSRLIIDLSTVEDGEVELCVIGINDQLVQQAFEFATSVQWLQKSNGPDQIETIVLKEGNGRLTLSWDPIELPDVNYVVIKSSIPQESISIRDGVPLSVGDQISGSEVVYVGTDPVAVDETVEIGQNYYYFVFVQDQYSFYSIPAKTQIIGVGQPLVWLPNDSNFADIGTPINAGMQPNSDGGTDNLYLCRGDVNGDQNKSPGQLVPGAGENIGVGGRCFVVEDGVNARGTAVFDILILRRGEFDDYLQWNDVTFEAGVTFVDGVQQAIPNNSIEGGVEAGNTLYICRGVDGGFQRPGKIAANYERCSVSSYDGATASLPTLNSWQVLSLKNLEEL